MLLAEVLDGLAVRPDGIYVDATFGRGGHAAALLARLGPSGRVYALDRDPQALAAGRARFSGEPRLVLAQGNFADLAAHCRAWGVTGRLAGLLLDLGVSSPQLDDPERGFSFRRDGPLDMRMDPGAGPSAAEWLAQASEREIAEALWRYGEERAARRIARRIVEQRRRAPIVRTGELARLVEAAVPARGPQRIHPATRTFQALRIVVNDELGALRAALDAAPELLAPGGRLAVISFHSLEDRLVKRFLQNRGHWTLPPRDWPVAVPPRLEPVGGLRRPSEAECAANPRARSARLRVARRPE
ncbi:MAG: ribosomal RNA small subunit methyltransferase H [Gammaproteobacteria bacterium]|nr:MAG: ribosomal RNA small subunit methyltransferase H [Gammaproteobacteria bacterium]